MPRLPGRGPRPAETGGAQKTHGPAPGPGACPRRGRAASPRTARGTSTCPATARWSAGHSADTWWAEISGSDTRCPRCAVDLRTRAPSASRSTRAAASSVWRRSPRACRRRTRGTPAPTCAAHDRRAGNHYAAQGRQFAKGVRRSLQVLREIALVLENCHVSLLSEQDRATVQRAPSKRFA